MALLVVPALVLLVALGMVAAERARPGRRWPSVPGWWARALALNAVQVGTVYLAGYAWDAWMRSRRPTA